MPVKTLYIVTKGSENKEVMRTEDKKYADWYDKKLDNATVLSEFISSHSDGLKNIKEDVLEDLCVFLSMNSNKVGKLLKGKDLEKVLEEETMDEYKK